MTADDVRNLMRRDIETWASSQTAWAKMVGVSQTYVSDVLAGKKEPSGKLLERFNLIRIVAYETNGCAHR